MNFYGNLKQNRSNYKFKKEFYKTFCKVNRALLEVWMSEISENKGLKKNKIISMSGRNIIKIWKIINKDFFKCSRWRKTLKFGISLINISDWMEKRRDNINSDEKRILKVLTNADKI